MHPSKTQGLKLQMLGEAFLNELFRKTYDINAMLGTLSKQSIKLHEISVNSAIAAGHVGVESSAFSEIARQIGTLSTYVSDAVTDAHAITTKISGCFLQCIVDDSKLKMMVSALNLIEDAYQSRTEAISDAAKFFDREISHQLCQAKTSLHLLNPSLSRFNQVIHRISSLVMSLKISSGISEDEEGAFFLPIATSLEVIGEESLKDLTFINKTVAELYHSLHSTFENDSRGNHAA